MNLPTTSLLRAQEILEDLPADRFTSRNNLQNVIKDWGMIERFNALSVRSDLDDIDHVVDYLVKRNILNPKQIIKELIKTRYINL